MEEEGNIFTNQRQIFIHTQGEDNIILLSADLIWETVREWWQVLVVFMDVDRMPLLARNVPRAQQREKLQTKSWGSAWMISAALLH